MRTATQAPVIDVRPIMDPLGCVIDPMDRNDTGSPPWFHPKFTPSAVEELVHGPWGQDVVRCLVGLALGLPALGRASIIRAATPDPAQGGPLDQPGNSQHVNEANRSRERNRTL